MDKFDELKFLHDRAQRLSERRQATSQIYLSINTAIFGALAFLIKDSGLQGSNLILISLPLFGVGLLACITWHRILWRLEAIIGWHYEQLREVERRVPKSNLTINKEWEQFFKEKGDEKFSFSGLESQLPKLLIALYAVYGLTLAIATILSWI